MEKTATATTRDRELPPAQPAPAHTTRRPGARYPRTRPHQVSVAAGSCLQARQIFIAPLPVRQGAGMELIQGETPAQAEHLAAHPTEEMAQQRLDLPRIVDVLVPHQQTVIETIFQPELHSRGELPSQRPQPRPFAGNGHPQHPVLLQQQTRPGDHLGQVAQMLEGRHGRDAVVPLLFGHFADIRPDVSHPRQ